MRTIFLLFDSLNRRMLECYGGTSIPTPNINRLAERGVCFDNHYAGSLPCMPARREIQTGRHNFLHRSWGPWEPFDDSLADVLEKNGVYSHLVTDHYHYWEEGGFGYHNRYSSFEFARGQEKDKWKGLVDLPVERWRQTYHPSRMTEKRDHALDIVNLINREFIKEEEDFSIFKTFDDAFHFLDTNREADNWMLNIECFDPHEPFMAPERFRDRFPTDYSGPVLDWPLYHRRDESPEQVAELRANYAALLSMCDEYLGRLLDYMDEHDMWRDTVVVLATDHGFLLGEHDWWGKMRMPFFNELVHTPLIVCHPDYADCAGERRSALTQTIDIMPTILDIHNIAAPENVQGSSLLPLLEDGDMQIHDACLYGLFGAAVNITDGRYTYFRYPENIYEQELYEYTLMPTHMRSYFAVEEFEGMSLAGPFDFTKGIKVMRIPARMGSARSPLKGSTIEDATNALYDLEADPLQQNPIIDPVIENRLISLMIELMRKTDAPSEAFRRLGLEVPDGISV